MTEDKITKALDLKFQIQQMTDFIYAIDKNTVGTLGHTKNCKIKFKWWGIRMWSKTNNKETEITVPKEFVCEIGEIAKIERDKLKAEFEAL